MAYYISIFNNGILHDVFDTPTPLGVDVVYPISDEKFAAISQDPNFGNWKWSGTDLEHLPVVTPTTEQNKAKAVQLLSQTDWVNQPDVIDPSVNPHLLNQSAFITYRAALRSIAITPQAGDLEWPTKPQEQWSV